MAADDSERRHRNYVIAGTVGAFLLPLAGAVGAVLFYSRGERDAASALLAGAIAGSIAYVIVFALL